MCGIATLSNGNDAIPTVSCGVFQKRCWPSHLPQSTAIPAIGTLPTQRYLLLDRALAGAQRVGEPVKPAYRLVWPREVNESDPDPDSPHLPLDLPQIAKDLDSIHNDLNSAGARLVVCSFKWFASGGAGLSPTRHASIYKHLNTYLWPLRYSDIRRLADFQNRFFRNYAAARGIGFADVASAVPDDPDLFADGIHMTEAGDRLRAWIFFQYFVRLLRPLLDSHQLPRPPASSPLPPPLQVTPTEMSAGCEAPSGPLTAVPGGLSLEEIRLEYQGSLKRRESFSGGVSARRLARPAAPGALGVCISSDRAHGYKRLTSGNSSARLENTSIPNATLAAPEPTFS